jgi:hypothetical protein
MSPLAEAVYDVLRLRPGRADPRITYAELARSLREASDALAHITHRSRELYAALGEVSAACRRLGLPCLAALVVRADSRRPGEAYFQGTGGETLHRGEKVAAWRQELEAVSRAVYPPRADSSGRKKRGAQKRTSPG